MRASDRGAWLVIAFGSWACLGMFLVASLVCFATLIMVASGAGFQNERAIEYILPTEEQTALDAALGEAGPQVVEIRFSYGNQLPTRQGADSACQAPIYD